MTQYEAGTSCTQALAWLGADVVKVEAPDIGDPGRGVGRTSTRDYSAYFCAWNANKRSLALDLRSRQGREILLELAPKFDVFVENYGPGVIERLKIGYDVLKAANPGIIYARIKGFGVTGPYSGYRCMDMGGTGGRRRLFGHRGSGGAAHDARHHHRRLRHRRAGSHAILAAYIQKQRTGVGQQVELSMQEAAAYYVRTRTYLGSGWDKHPAPRTGNAGGVPPVNIYPCKPFGANDYIYLMPVNEGHWDALCASMDRGDLLLDPRFADAGSRIENGNALYEEIRNWTGQRTKYEGNGGHRRRRRPLFRLPRHGGTAPRPAPHRARFRARDEPARARHGADARVRATAVGIHRGNGAPAAVGRAHPRGTRRRPRLSEREIDALQERSIIGDPARFA